MWLTDRGQLQPKVVYPQDESRKLELNEKLTQRVVKKRHMLRIQHASTQGGDDFADSLCLPLIMDGEVSGALHLYRQDGLFEDAHLKLASSVANIMIRSLQRANRQATIEADNQRLASAAADTLELIGSANRWKH